MGQQVDAVIIGAGVIGTATAFELGKRGYRTLNVDKLPSAGYGPTSNSCAIVRAHYSSFDGVAMAYEGFFYWKNWAEYLEARRRVGSRQVHAVGHDPPGERDRAPRQGPAALRPLGRAVRGVGHGHARAQGADLRRARVLAALAPVRRRLRCAARQQAPRRDLHARLRLRQRPAALLAQPPAGGRGRGGRVPLSPQGHRDPSGRRPGARSHARRRQRDRREDRRQRRRTALVRDQPHGRRRGRHEDQDARRCATRCTTSRLRRASTTRRTATTSPTATTPSTSGPRPGTTS